MTIGWVEGSSLLTTWEALVVGVVGVAGAVGAMVVRCRP